MSAAARRPRAAAFASAEPPPRRGPVAGAAMTRGAARDAPPGAGRSARPAGRAVWVVMPAFNEATVIGDTARDVLAHHPHVVVVDDGSVDDTAQEAAGSDTRRTRGRAARETKPGADLIVTFDADGQHRVGDVAVMIDALERSGSDVALGSRFLGSTVGLPASRRLLLKLAIRFTTITTGLRLSDAHNGLRVLTRKAAEAIEIRQDRMAHASEIVHCIARSRLRYVEVPVTVVYTAYSLAKGQRFSNLLKILGEMFGGRMQQ